MGFSGKSQPLDHMGFDSDPKKTWVVAGIPLRAPLKPLYTNPVEQDDGEECSTTPTAEESRIPAILTCPPAPRKRKAGAASKCKFNGVREFFTPPDLETVFIRRHVERAN
ncbi:hypothetical protein ACFXTH_011653 [Malus domestica]